MSDVQRELEHIHKLAIANPEYRFDKLYKLVGKVEMLTLAWERIKRNKGSRTPGVDGETREDIDEVTLLNLSRGLKSGEYVANYLRGKYIPKKNGKLRQLGIPTLRDRIVQKAVAMILEAIYEPDFRPCSHGFRPNRSCISALRHVAYSYKAGADWIIEGDIKSCFDVIPHHVLLNTLRKRIRDEHFLVLISKFLKAGVMLEGQLRNTYSGTPQGGTVSPILANIVLHEFDTWLETAKGANPTQASLGKWEQRQTPEHKHLTYKIKHLRRVLKQGEPFSRQRTVAEVKVELKQYEDARHKTRPSERLRTLRYVRYADDFLVVLSGMTQEEAQALKGEMAAWLQENLGLTLSEEKTLITHADEKLRFLGYDLQGLHNPNGTRWLRLSIPTEKQREVVEKLKQAVRYRHAPEYDVFLNVNAVVRGWCNYFRFANNASTVFGRLTGIVYWLTAHYMGRKLNVSIAKIMRKYYKRDPISGRMALSIVQREGRRLFIWNHYPKHQSIYAAGGYAEDRQPVIYTVWADGHSREKRAERIAAVGGQCEGCGAENVPLVVHHPKRLKNAGKSTTARANSGYEQASRVLCKVCHQAYHHGDTARK